jgi:cytochrome c-type biogenesis protein CcmH
VADGRSDGEIERFLVSRYGQFVLLTPKASFGNAILWIGPLLIVAAGAAALVFRGRKGLEPTSLTEQEEAELDELRRQALERETS